ncbi:MAG: ComF family protein, partial [Chloroflexota bacterium]
SAGRRPGEDGDVMSDLLPWLGGFLKDAVYPRRCADCGSRGAWVCDICRDALPLFSPPWCSRCGTPDVLAACQCARMPPEIAMARSSGLFAGWLRGSILGLKYHGERDRAGYLGEMLAAAAPAAAHPLLVPVPLHAARERSRGYNQSELIARVAADHLGWPCELAVERVRETRSQVGLGAAERAANTAGAFTRSEAGRKIDFTLVTPVLVADVFTPGATQAAAAMPMIAAGAGRVIALTLAREL